MAQSGSGSGSRMGQQGVARVQSGRFAGSRSQVVGGTGGGARNPAANYPGNKYPPLQETPVKPASSHTPSSRSTTTTSSSSGAGVSIPHNTSVTSLSSAGDTNELEVGIDSDIVAAADDVKNQVKGETVGEDAPFDPNLECPTCGRGFKIGQIQMFRQHAASCNNKK